MLVDRKALIVGIDNYPTAPLKGCVSDAVAVTLMLSEHEDCKPNFHCLPVNKHNEPVTRALLKRRIIELFSGQAEVALLYFAGHGTAGNLGGYLVTQDATKYDEGVSMNEVLSLANQSTKIGEIVVLLDCCNSGYFGQAPGVANDAAVLREGLAVMTASRADQSALETKGGGIFTKLLLAALAGGASDILGKTTIASVYAYVDQITNIWGQRPLFKSNLSTLTSLRECKPSVPLEELRMLPKDFPTIDHEKGLDPSYEPYKDDPEFAHIKKVTNPDHEKVFKRLQKFRAARLLVPVDEDHMYYVAMRSKSCKLTLLGHLYWQLAFDKKF